MNTNHTPGPWIIQPDNESENRVLVTDSSTESFIMAEGFLRDNPRHMADARLIASAPDLLAALEVMLAIVEQEARDTKYDNAKQAARAVIAQATGGGGELGETR